jgi:hypothetical protein
MNTIYNFLIRLGLRIKHYKATSLNIFACLIALILMCAGCKKLVEVDGPYTSINKDNLYSNDATAIGIMSSVYAGISTKSIFAGGLASISVFSGLSADEFAPFSGITDATLIGYYKNSLTNSTAGVTDSWSNIYPIIYVTNTIIEGLNSSTSLTLKVKQQLLGEALFVRAFCYFYLVNLYGDVPLSLTTDYVVNADLSRSEKEQVWKQIISDLKNAKDLLSSEYPDKTLIATTTERVRPTKWAAMALLARVYLFTNNYIDAEQESSTVINNNSLFATVMDLNQVFKNSSTEAIWQLQPVNSGWNTEDARWFIIPLTGPNSSYPIILSSFVLNSFENGDQRKVNWINNVKVGTNTYYYPYKYKNATLGDPVTEYASVLRLSEQYLIRAEAKAQQNNITGNEGALIDLNKIRNRAGLLDYSGPMDKNSVLNAILHERQVELFSEWGHRWLDLKRTGKVDAVMNDVTPLKGGSWNHNWQLYPIPLNELEVSPKVKQNPGYE